MKKKNVLLGFWMEVVKKVGGGIVMWK